MEVRNLRKERTGIVVSNKMEKTITVAAKFKEKHPIYGKFVSRTKKYCRVSQRYKKNPNVLHGWNCCVPNYTC